jgi:hypothetical protein
MDTINDNEIMQNLLGEDTQERDTDTMGRRVLE